MFINDSKAKAISRLKPSILPGDPFNTINIILKYLSHIWKVLVEIVDVMDKQCTWIAAGRKGLVQL